MSEENIIRQIFVTESCNQNCLFCSYDRHNLNNKDLTNAKCVEIINKINPNSEVVIDGGEPTIRKDFFELLALIKEKKPKRIILNTNGLMLCYNEFAKKLKLHGIDEILISLHSHKLEISDKITRVKGGFQKTIKGIKNMLNLNQKISISFVINELNYTEILDFIKFNEKELNKTHITFSYVMPSGNALKNKWIIPKISKVIPYLKQALSYCVKNNISFSFTGCSIPPCFLKGYEQHTGELLLANNKYLLERETGKTTRHITDGKTKPETCKKCKYDPICGGLWKEYVKLYGFGEIPTFNEKDHKDRSDLLKNDILTITNLKEDSEKKPRKDCVSLAAELEDELNFYEKVQKELPMKNNIYLIFESFLKRNIGIIDEEYVKNEWIKYIASYKNHQFNFYISIPFCKSACSYCIYPSTKYDSKSMEIYLDYLENQIKKYSHIFNGIKFKTLYIGGGTPSLLTTNQMKTLFSCLFNNFEFEVDGQKNIEVNPNSINLQKLKILYDLGFTRISFGVQSFSESVLNINNRSIQIDMVRSLIVNALKIGFKTISADLVLGLKGDTTKLFLESFRKLAYFGPDTIFIYPIKTTPRKCEKEYGSETEFDKIYLNLHKSVSDDIFDLAESLGYVPTKKTGKTLGFINPTEFCKKITDRKRNKYYYRHHCIDQEAVLGIGYYANPIIPNSLDYIFKDKNTNERIFLKNFSSNPDDFVISADIIDKDFKKIKYLVLSLLHHKKINIANYFDKFGSEILEDYSWAIRALEYFKILTLDDKNIICEDINELDLFKYLLFFIGKDKIKLYLKS